GDLDLEGPRPATAAAAAAGRAWRLDDATRAVADGAGLAHLGRPLFHGAGARTPAPGTGRRARARRRAAAVTRLARGGPLDPDRHGRPPQRAAPRERRG